MPEFKPALSRNRRNHGILFEGDEIKDQPHDSDYYGDADVGGKKVWINGYVRKDKFGREYILLTFKPKPSSAHTRDHPRHNTEPPEERGDL